MLPHDWKKILTLYREIKKKDPHAFDSTFDALEKWRCLTVLWGFDDPGSVRFQNSDDKRHFLLAYKYLGVIWFDRLPESQNHAFEILVHGIIPRDATEKKVLSTFNRGNKALERMCKEISRPKWGEEDVKSLVISLASFPLEAAR